MATAESLGGRRTPSSPKPKGDKTVTFIGSDGNELEVLASISKPALRILKKQGYRKQSEVLREQEEAALAKGGMEEEEVARPDESWKRPEIDQWAAELDPPLDTTGASNKEEALKLIEDRLAEDDDSSS